MQFVCGLPQDIDVDAAQEGLLLETQRSLLGELQILVDERNALCQQLNVSPPDAPSPCADVLYHVPLSIFPLLMRLLHPLPCPGHLAASACTSSWTSPATGPSFCP